MSLPPLLPGPPKWDEQHAAELRTFLISPLAQRLLQTLVYLRPLVSSVEPETRRIQQDERSGFEACIAEILSLAESK
jgi:hypothetical protein